jgi:outer membrane protein TolC
VLSANLTDLAKAKLEAARGEYEARFIQFVAGRGTLDFLLDTSRRLLDSERAVTTKEADLVAAFERHWIVTKQIEEVNKSRYDAGRISIEDLLQSTYFRLQAEIWLVEAREKNKKK